MLIDSRKIRILMIHNYYQQRGGEDGSTERDVNLLRAYGHNVTLYSKHNDEIYNYNIFQKTLLFFRPMWSMQFYREVKAIIEKHKIDVVHVQNFFPLISPSVYYAAKHCGVPVIQTLRNYRLFCPSALFFRDNEVCQDCLGKVFPWPGVLHTCYRDNYIASLATAMMLGFHNMLGTWKKKVDIFIALTEFARAKVVEAGLPDSKVVIKPNFVPLSPVGGAEVSQYAIFVGRLSPEKGVTVLLNAWKKLASDLPLKIIGDGPLTDQVSEFAETTAAVEYLGRQPNDRVIDLMSKALILVFPSVWYEGFPRVIVEAFSVGLPVVASDLGSMSSLIEPYKTGMLFQPGNVEDLCSKLDWLLENPESVREMRRTARKEYETKYTAEHNYEILMKIYRRAISNSTELR